MIFDQSQMRIALVLALGGLTVGCNAGSDGNWVELENYGESALYLDMSSVARNTHQRTFKTKLATPGWNGLFSNIEIRNTYQMDCNAKTFRQLKGGSYADGRLQYSHDKLGAGKVGTRGYAKLLYDRVCHS